MIFIVRMHLKGRLKIAIGDNYETDLYAYNDLAD